MLGHLQKIHFLRMDFRNIEFINVNHNNNLINNYYLDCMD